MGTEGGGTPKGGGLEEEAGGGDPEGEMTHLCQGQRGTSDPDEDEEGLR